MSSTTDSFSVRRADTQLDDPGGLERLAFFSDAVFAIAITLLALDIRLPAATTAEASNAALTRSLVDLWPIYLSYILSFLMIGNFWIAHHGRFGMLVRYDTRFLLLNLLQLMAVAFIPFATAVIGENGNRTATIFYALAIAVAGLASALMWWYALAGNRLVDSVDPSIARRHLISILTIPAVFLLSIVVAFIDPNLAKASWILTVPAALMAR